MGSGEESSRSYFEELIRISAEATSSGPSRTHALKVAGRRVALHFSDSTFENKILPALLHLSTQATGEPALRIHLWDSAATRFRPPVHPWEVPPGEPWFYQTGSFRATYLPDSEILLLLDHAASVAVFWTADAAKLPIVEQGSPLLRLWAWWLGKGDIQFTHAGAIGNEAGAALLLGPGGSGKSTTALQCLNSRLSYLADDYCLIRSSPQPTVYSIYSSGKVNAGDQIHFPWLADTFAALDAEKALFHLYPRFADRIAAERPLKMLLRCRVMDQEDSTVEPIPSTEVTRASAPSTIVQLRSVIDPVKALHTMAEIARQVPAFRLNLGRKRDQIPDLLGQLLER